MDEKDKELLNLIQTSFPIEKRPYYILAQELNISQEDVIKRVDSMKKKGYIRKLGCILDSRKVGYYSTLCTLKVPEGRIEEVSTIINSYSGVTHNYIREHEYNMWFTLIASSKEKINETLQEIKIKSQISSLINLPASKVFKIKVNFNMKEM